MTPCAVAAEMYSKCGVPPRITHPRHSTASNRPGLGRAPRRLRQLEGARHVHLLDVGVGRAGFAQRRPRRVAQASR